MTYHSKEELLYQQLKEDGALPKYFSGDWHTDREEFLKLHTLNEELDLDNIISTDDFFNEDHEIL